MKKIITSITVAASLFLPLIASAHQHASLLIGGKQYDIVIGSLSEPLVVDDKTGLDLRITSGGHMMKAADGEMEPMGGKPALGLEKDVKVEMIAGSSRKIFQIAPAYGQPGSYKTTFYATVPTTFSYRLFGTINKTPFDMIFTCLPEGAAAADEGTRDVAPGVKLLMMSGGFGCPVAKEKLGFPENSTSLNLLASESNAAKMFGEVGIALGAVALVFAAIARKRTM